MREDRIVLLIGLVLALMLLGSALSSCSPTIKYLCPQLAPPPSKTVDALESAGRSDPSSAAWVIGLEKHYEKLDACTP